nr:transposase (putative), gypsy type [Tanacetum cinerariifolium]
MGRDTVQLETAVSTISQEYLLEFTSEYGISEALHPELPGLEDRIVDFPEGKVGVYTKFFEFANFRLPLSQFLFDILGYYQINLSQLSVICAAKQEAWEKYPVMLHQALRLFKKLEQPLLLGGREGVPNYRRLAHECSKRWDAGRENVLHEGCENTRHTPYLNPETTRDIDLFNLIRPPNPTKSTGPEDQKTAAPEVPPPENVPTVRGAPEAGPAERVAATDLHAVKERRKRGHDGVDTNAPPKLLRRDHVDPRPTESTRGGESLASIELGMGSTRPSPTPQGVSADVSDSNPLSFADPQSRPSTDVARSSKGAAAAGDPESENTSCASMLRLRFEQEAKLLKKSVAQVVHRDKRIQARENEIKNLETLLEAEAYMKKAAEDKSAELSQELENMRGPFSDLQVSNNRLSQQVSTLQEQVSEEEKLKAAFEEFKRYEDKRVEQRCAEMDARLDALSIDFYEELYPHMLTAIAGRRWMIRRGLRLAVMKCGESIELR